MDERGNTTKVSSYSKNRSVLGYALFALMLIMGGVGVAFVVKYRQSAPATASTFTPFLSEALVGVGGKCTVIPDAEDFATCSTAYEKVDEPQVLRCPKGYGNIEVQKVRDGETHHKNYRDMAVLRHECKGMDACKYNVAELRAGDDGMPFDDEPLPEEELEPELDPEAIIEDVAGVDSNGHVLMKHHGHGHHHKNHPNSVKVYYECEKLEQSPFEALETFFDDMLGPGDLTIEEVDVEEMPGDVPATEEIAQEEVPILLSKKHKKGGKCGGALKNLAQDWDAGAVCGTMGEEIKLSCDNARAASRIFVLSVQAKGHHNHNKDTGANTDPVIEDTQNSVAEEPFLSKRGGHKHGHGGAHKQGKKLGLDLTDHCSQQDGFECSVILNDVLGTALTQNNPLIDETTPMHVKYMCSYAHQEN